MPSELLHPVANRVESDLQAALAGHPDEEFDLEVTRHNRVVVRAPTRKLCLTLEVSSAEGHWSAVAGDSKLLHKQWPDLTSAIDGIERLTR